MSEQPEALWLADAITHPEGEPTWETCVKAAAELRRLHEEVQEQCRINGMGAERELRLMAEKRELLEALVQICVRCRSNEWGPDTPRKEILNWMHDHTSAAIAKAEGETK